MARRRRGPLGCLVALVVVLALLAVALVVGDGYARGRVEDEVATRLQERLGASAPPEVTIGGTPFLTQAVRQHLGEVRVRADDLQPPDSPVALQQTDLTLHDVTSTNWFQTSTAARIDGTARLSYATLGGLAGVPFTSVAGGRVGVERTVTVFGREIGATVTGVLKLSPADQTVTLVDPDIELADVALPEAVTDQLVARVLEPVQVGALPFGLRLTGLITDDDGAVVSLTGTDVPLQS